MAKRRHARTFHIAAAVTVTIACLLCYANTAGNAFVVGDLQFIQNNAALNGSGVFATAFTHGYWWVGAGNAGEAGTYYRPFVVLLDAWDHYVSGDNPFGFHLTNTLLHVAVSLLVFRLARAFLRSPIAALGAALLFAVHPLHVHAVSYISARSALLCTLFYVGAVIVAFRYRRGLLSNRKRPSDLALVVVCYAGGLLSLEATITLPVALAVVLYPPSEGRRAWLRSVAPLFVSLFVVTAVYFIVRRVALGALLSQKEALVDNLPLVPAALTIAKTYAYYLVKLVVPTDVSYLPPFVPVFELFDLSGLLSLGAVLALSALVVAGPPRFFRERAALGWILLTLAPTLGVVPLDHFVKGQYGYLPSVGSCIFFASLARRALSAFARRAPPRVGTLVSGGIFAVVLVAYAIQTVVENTYWHSSESLFARVIELEPDIPDEIFSQPVMTPTANRFASVHLQIAAELVEAKQCKAARPEYLRAGWLTRRKSIKLQVRQLEAYCLFMTADYDGALAAYLPLVEAAPADSLAPERVAWLLLRRGKPVEALPYLNLACERGSEIACREVRRRAGAGK